MPFTQSQILDIKPLFKESVKDIFENTEFVGHLTNLIAKNIDKKFDNILKTYTARCEELERENMMLKSKIDNMEQYTRRNSIRIFGIPEKNDENIQAIVLNLCKDELNVDLTAPSIDRVHRMYLCTKYRSSSSDGTQNIQAIVLNLCKDELNVDLTAPSIDRVHRMGPWRTQEKKRGIILKLTNHWYKDILLRNRYKLKGTGVFICEDLTQSRRDLYKHTQQKCGVKNTFIRDGMVFAKVGGSKHKINSIEDLETVK
ncbi:hypothetical protein QE152_g31955 [Popillia japonica]|uniref:Uncharacterized protein n=1 Tax=Popillia japonica TaxID=7064 RepID=A0AAW1J0K7_POPJA